MKIQTAWTFAALAVACAISLQSRAAAPALPTVTIDDSTDTLTVNGTGFNTLPIIGTKLFASGNITVGGISEGVWFAGIGGNVAGAPAFKAGYWLDPSGSGSDLFIVGTRPLVAGIAASPGVTFGVFLSDPDVINIPNSFQVPLPTALANLVTINVDLTGLKNLLGTTEPTGPVNISPDAGVIVNATSDVETGLPHEGEVPDAGSTLVLLGAGVAAISGVRSFRRGK